MVSRIVRTPRGWADPEVPIQTVRHGLGRQGRIERHIGGADLRDVGRSPNGEDLLDVTETAAPNKFAHVANGWNGSILRAGLKNTAVAADSINNPAALGNGERNRFLAIDILARGSGVTAYGSVPVIGCD